MPRKRIVRETVTLYQAKTHLSAAASGGAQGVRGAMNLLLDTPVLIWWDEARRLSAESRRAIEDAEAAYVSAATGWKIAIKIGLGRRLPVCRPRSTAAGSPGSGGGTHAGYP